MLKRLLSQAIGAGRPSPGPASPAPSTDLSSDDAPASSSAPELHTDLEQLETRQDVQQQEDIWRDAMEVQKNTAAQANTSEQQQHDGGGGDDATDSSSDVEMLDPGHIAPLSDALSDSDDDHKPSLAQLKASADASRASGRSAPLSGPSAARPTLLPTPPSSSAEAPIEKSETSVLDYFIRAQIEASRAQQEAERGTSLDMSALSSTDRIRAMGIQARTELLRTIEGALALPQQPSAAALYASSPLSQDSKLTASTGANARLWTSPALRERRKFRALARCPARVGKRARVARAQATAPLSRSLLPQHTLDRLLSTWISAMCRLGFGRTWSRRL